MSYNPIAYTYEADIHCPDCAMKAFGQCKEHHQIACCVEDSEGNEPGVMFELDEPGDASIGEYCGDCGEVIIEPYAEEIDDVDL